NPVMNSIGISSSANPDLPAIILHQEDGSAARFEQTGRNTYRSIGATNPVTEAENAILTVVSPEIITIDGIDRDIVPITLHDQPDPEDAFDNVFIAQAKAVNLSASYRGYDITRMDPLHLVEAGTSRNVFELPGAGSTDYHDHNRIFVPNGLIYVPEFTGKTRVTTTTIRTSDDLRKAYSSTVGSDFNVLGFGFGNSRSHNEAIETLTSRDREMSISIARATFYDLVLDKARMPLGEEFEARIERLIDRPDYRGFVETFGTHYAAAVVYGGMGLLQMEYTSEMRRKAEESGESLNTQIQAAAEKTASGSVNSGESRENRNVFEEQFGSQTENFYWVGGTHAGSSKDSWSVGEDGAVPIYVQLRPLSELLAPPYFTDPVILRRVRPNLQEAIDAYIAENAARSFVGAEVPRIYELEFVSVKIDDFGDEPNEQLELSGFVNVEIPVLDASNDSDENTGDVLQVMELDDSENKPLMSGEERLNIEGTDAVSAPPVKGELVRKVNRLKRFAVAPDVVERRGRVRLSAMSLIEKETETDSNDRLNFLRVFDTDPDDELTPERTISFRWAEAGTEGKIRSIRVNGCDEFDSPCSPTLDLYLNFRLREVFPSDIRDITEEFVAARGQQ
ncbi:MAG: MAC/perforin domain-containing protein, partial [Pseudomonadota bacterium]